MRAESNGRNNAKNPRSSALGPFQFIKSTFLAVMRKYFPGDVAKLSERQILALRTDRGFARRAAEAFSRENMDYLADKGINPTFGHLRLAFLLGPEGAARVLQAPPAKPVARILGSSVIAANPFMRRMSAADLVARATRDVSPRQQTASAEQPKPAESAPTPAAQPEQEQPTLVADAGAGVQPERPAPAPEPAPTADLAPAPEAAPAAEPKSLPAPRATVVATHLGSVRRGERVSVIDVKCDSRQASCQRWIDQQVAKLVRTKVAVNDAPGA